MPEVVHKGIAAGISLRVVSHMYSPGKSQSGVLLGLGGFTDEEIYAAVRTLGRVLLAAI
jgi:GntR family transcriptional regulator/MocR family aminotransferase